MNLDIFELLTYLIERLKKTSRQGEREQES